MVRSVHVSFPQERSSVTPESPDRICNHSIVGLSLPLVTTVVRNAIKYWVFFGARQTGPTPSTGLHRRRVDKDRVTGVRRIVGVDGQTETETETEEDTHPEESTSTDIKGHEERVGKNRQTVAQRVNPNRTGLVDPTWWGLPWEGRPPEER